MIGDHKIERTTAYLCIIYENERHKKMKKTIAVIFGGQSSEHEVSCVSAVTIITNMDTEKYEQILIGITKEGDWLKVDSVSQIEDGSWREASVHAVISVEATAKSIMFLEDGKVSTRKLDLVFPALHGLYGEDGTIQGVMELARLPYVGCGVLASSISMDKLCTKTLVGTMGIRQAQYVPVMRYELKDMEFVVKKVEKKLSYPMFVKPCNAGSSRGVSKVRNSGELKVGLSLAAEHDRKLLVEEMIVGRELECAVLGGDNCCVSGVGEILAAADFYDYEAKYHSAESRTDLAPVLPEGKEDEIRETAAQIFTALDGYGLSRLDFFLTEDTNEVVFNEMNTLPGFTGISMYPMLWEKRGISKQELIDKLIAGALIRYDR